MTRLHTTAQYLKAYSQGEIGPEIVIEALCMRGFGELLDAMARHDLSLPRGWGREKAVEREVRECLPLVRDLLGLGKPAGTETTDRSP
ncbi:MAG: hypothetical protein OXF74_07665 [Rhodobacteraceae bacterium]|nr:hypothetical protein [Paracoccaceae bacterium]